MEIIFRIYTHFTTNESKLRLHDRKKALFSFKNKLFFFLFLHSTTNVHRLRTPCPRRGIVKYYTEAGRDVRSVTVSNFSSLFLPVTSRGISRPYQKCKLRDARRWRVFDIHHSELLFLLANYFRTVCHDLHSRMYTREKLFAILRFRVSAHTQLISKLNEHAQLSRTITNVADVSRKSCNYRTFPAHFSLKPIWRRVRIFEITAHIVNLKW